MNIESRLAKLERENRTWRLAAISLAGILGLSIACSSQWDESAAKLPNQAIAQPSDVPPIHERLRVRTLEIVDDNGRILGRWNSTEGMSSLEMWAGDSTVAVRAHQEFASITFRGGDLETSMCQGDIRISRRGPEQREAQAQLEKGDLSATETGRLLRQSFSVPLVILAANEETVTGNIAIYNSSGKMSAAVSTGEGGGGVLGLYNSFGARVATLQSDKTNQGLLLLSEASGKPARSLSAN